MIKPSPGTITLLILVWFLTAMTAQAQRPEPKKTEVKGHTMYTLLEPGGIPAIFDPQFIAVQEADSFYYADEPLIAVVVSDVAKAYSTWHLDHHEIVNDYIDGRAITVTW